MIHNKYRQYRPIFTWYWIKPKFAEITTHNLTTSRMTTKGEDSCSSDLLHTHRMSGWEPKEAHSQV